jgi:hypothetical protein
MTLFCRIVCALVALDLELCCQVLIQGAAAALLSFPDAPVPIVRTWMLHS